MKENIEESESIHVLGARVHNLKNIDVEIPRNKFVVITGLSGSGKSSLAFDTIFAEGQRRYIETFSAYARNFLGNMERPDVDKITIPEFDALYYEFKYGINAYLKYLATVDGGAAYMVRHEEKLKALANEGWTQGVVLGDAELAGICDEGSLTFKEVCQLPSNFYHLLDVRHGPMVMINKDTLVLVALSAPNNPYELALVDDLLAKGAKVVCYSDTPLDIPGVLNIDFGQALDHPARGIPFIAMCQLITYYKSLLTGANPDQPDGLEPWISLG